MAKSWKKTLKREGEGRGSIDGGTEQRKKEMTIKKSLKEKSSLVTLSKMETGLPSMEKGCIDSVRRRKVSLSF